MECRIFLVFYAVFLEKYSAQQNIWWVVSRYELKIILLWKCLAPRYSVYPIRYKLNQISGEGNGNPLQFSCLGNPRDGGAWWVAVYGVAQSRTQLKWFSSSRSNQIRDLELGQAEMHSFLKAERDTSRMLQRRSFYLLSEVSWGRAMLLLPLLLSRFSRVRLCATL